MDVMVNCKQPKALHYRIYPHSHSCNVHHVATDLLKVLSYFVYLLYYVYLIFLFSLSLFLLFMSIRMLKKVYHFIWVLEYYSLLTPLLSLFCVEVVSCMVSLIIPPSPTLPYCLMGKEPNFVHRVFYKNQKYV